MVLRRRLALAACLAIGLVWLAVYALKVEDRLLSGGNDFLQLYAGAKLARTPQLYDAEAAWRIHRDAVGYRLPSVVHTRLPFYSFLLQPLAWLSYPAAYWTFLILNFLGIFWFCWRFFSATPAYAFLVASFPPLFVAILGGNDLGLVLALLGGGILLLRGNRDFAAGLLLSLCAIKFHLFVFVPAVLWITGRRRALAGGLAGTTFLLALSFAVQGAGWPQRYLDLLRNPLIHPQVQAMPNLHGLMQTLLPSVATPATLIVSALTAVVVIACAWRRRDDWQSALALALLGGLLVSWHCYIQDAVLLLPVLVLLVPSRPPAAVLAPFALTFLPFTFWMLSASAPWCSIPPLLLTAVLAGACWQALRPGRRLTEGNLALFVEMPQN